MRVSYPPYSRKKELKFLCLLRIGNCITIINCATEASLFSFEIFPRDWDRPHIFKSWRLLNSFKFISDEEFNQQKNKKKL